MSYYNTFVPDELVEKLYGAGCADIERYERDGVVFYSETFYSEVFDWMIEKDISIELQPEPVLSSWLSIIEKITEEKTYAAYGPFSTWHEAANAAIEKAIEILKER